MSKCAEFALASEVFLLSHGCVQRPTDPFQVRGFFTFLFKKSVRGSLRSFFPG